MILERAGHEVRAAADRDQAQMTFDQFDPERVVLDLRLPDVEDGLALIRHFHATVSRPRLIVLSGYTPDLDGRPERDMVDTVLEKPLRTERLLEALA